jgi:hypothetical protein
MRCHAESALARDGASAGTRLGGAGAVRRWDRGRGGAGAGDAGPGMQGRGCRAGRGRCGDVGGVGWLVGLGLCVELEVGAWMEVAGALRGVRR